MCRSIQAVLGLLVVACSQVPAAELPDFNAIDDEARRLMASEMPWWWEYNFD